MGFHLFEVKKSYREILNIRRRGSNKNALIIYIPSAIKEWISNKYIDDHFKGHSMYWESIEMVLLLNADGFDVDYADCMKPVTDLNWSKYQLIIDERNNMHNVPRTSGQKRIFYATGCNWVFHNENEKKRLFSFEERYNIKMPAQRQVEPTPFESQADVVTFFGSDFQKDLFTYPNKTYELALSSSFIPIFKQKEIKNSRQNILWLGSRGFIHKGLDIVLEAFKKKANFNLHICANLQIEPGFYDWFKMQFSDCTNIYYYGWKDVYDLSFQHLAETCIATVYCSAAEGGAGAVIQAMQFGCIPITSDSTCLRAYNTGFMLSGQSSEELLSSIEQVLDDIVHMTDRELLERSAVVRSYANRNHSRDAYSKSFNQLISLIDIA